MAQDSDAVDVAALLGAPQPLDARTRRAGYWGSTVHIRSYDRASDKCYIGSGLLLCASGYLITNFHVLNHSKDAQVRLHGDLAGEEGYTLTLERLLCKHQSYDLMLARCLVPKRLQRRLSGTLPPIALSSQDPPTGTEVRVYGFKNEVVEERVGRIIGKEEDRSRFGRSFLPRDLHNKREVAWYTDTDIEKGFSGGPVVNAATGELLGLTWASVGFIDEPLTNHSYISVDGVRRVLRAYLHATQDNALRDAAAHPPTPSISPDRTIAMLGRCFRRLFRD